MIEAGRLALAHTLPHDLVADDDAALGQEILGIPDTEARAVIEPLELPFPHHLLEGDSRAKVIVNIVDQAGP